MEVLPKIFHDTIIDYKNNNKTQTFSTQYNSCH